MTAEGASAIATEKMVMTMAAMIMTITAMMAITTTRVMMMMMMMMMDDMRTAVNRTSWL